MMFADNAGQVVAKGDAHTGNKNETSLLTLIDLGQILSMKITRSI